MDANGENMDRKWQKETLVLVHTTDAPWQLVALFANRYAFLFNRTVCCCICI